MTNKKLSQGTTEAITLVHQMPISKIPKRNQSWIKMNQGNKQTLAKKSLKRVDKLQLFNAFPSVLATTTLSIQSEDLVLIIRFNKHEISIE